MPVLSSSVIASRIKELPALPVSWFVKRVNDLTLHHLDLRACGIQELLGQVVAQFSLSSAGSRPTRNDDLTKSGRLSQGEAILSYPELILKIDLSVNDLIELRDEDLIIFSELRSLNASLNAIHSFEGIRAAKRLVHLNLSYNNISRLPNEALAECVNLQSLDLSVNKIPTLSGFPNLPNLTKLILRRNKLKDLLGIQGLRSLKHLDCSKNKLNTIIHVCPCLELTELYITDNQLGVLLDIISAISPLVRLQQIAVKGNPFCSLHPAADIRLIFLKETTVVLIDGLNIRPAKVQFEGFYHREAPNPDHDLKTELKNAVRESMKEGTERKKRKTKDSIAHLHGKILSLLEELEEHEDLAVADTEAWCRYIDTLTMDEAKSLTVSQIRAAAIAEADGYIPMQVTTSSSSASRSTERKA